MDIPSNVTMTPMMEQYWRLKNQYPEELLFYRLGDFYELFHQDALIAAKELGITLTRRGKSENDDIPMCGVPFHNVDPYLVKLVEKGYRIAICEQMESPEDAKKRGAKGPLARDVVRIVTRGTLIEDHLLPDKQNNYLAALSLIGKDGTLGVAVVDVSTGEFTLESITQQKLEGVLARIAPSELIVPDDYLGDEYLLKILKPFLSACTPLPKARFNVQNATERLLTFFKTPTLAIFGTIPETCLVAGGMALDYLYLTHKNVLPHLGYPKISKPDHQTLFIDAATYSSLQLTHGPDKQSSLLYAIDKTLTPMGFRRLSHNLVNPLTDASKIEKRLTILDFFYGNLLLCQTVRQLLTACPDGERALSRMMMHKSSPKDLGMIRQTLGRAQEMATILSAEAMPDICSRWHHTLTEGASLLTLLQQALADDPLPLTGFIKEGYDSRLDELRYLQTNHQTILEALQKRYIQETGITHLKIKHNNMLGYFIDIPASQSQKVPPEFIHRQSLSTNQRYTTLELSQCEREIANATQESHGREAALYAELIEHIHIKYEIIKNILAIMAQIDVIQSHAVLARDQHYCRPLVDESLTLHIEQGRHPVIEQLQSTFVGNSCDFGDKRFWVVTGPNMGGKSTFLRQNALIIIMAQMGMYVPAQKAHIGIVDRVSSRVGASDDLSKGRSTFMVEMIETATILHQSTNRSFVILDEIGRGTATYDGLAIAIAVLEHLYHTIQCRTLFATHYHEIAHYHENLEHLGFLMTQVDFHQNDIIFLHQIIQGSAHKSYGVYVASRAGLPHTVVKRAEAVMKTLESGDFPKPGDPAGNRPENRPENRRGHKLSEAPIDGMIAIDNINPMKDYLTERLNGLDSLTPKQALDLLYTIKNDIGEQF